MLSLPQWMNSLLIARQSNNMENNKFNLALLSACAELAKVPGKTDEEIVASANEIFADAQLENPLTLAGQNARKMAADIVATQATGNIPSPYSPKFDYEKLRNATSIPAMVEIIKKMGEVAEGLPIKSVTTDEEEKLSEKAYNDLTMAAFAILDNHGVGMKEYKYIFDSLKAVISAMEDVMINQITNHRHEIMSRQFGVRNPGNNKFDANYATYQALKDTLLRVRKETGDNMQDYFSSTTE